MMMVVIFIFFFKQKPAYEFRICDWSSDVCSSDLEPLGNLDAIHRPGITFVASQMLLLAEVLRILGIGSSDDVPAGPAVAQMVQRGELAGKQERLLIGRVRGGNEADMPGVLSQRGQEDRKSTRLNSSH